MRMYEKKCVRMYETRKITCIRGRRVLHQLHRKNVWLKRKVNFKVKLNRHSKMGGREKANLILFPFFSINFLMKTNYVNVTFLAWFRRAYTSLLFSEYYLFRREENSINFDLKKEENLMWWLLYEVLNWNRNCLESTYSKGKK